MQATAIALDIKGLLEGIIASIDMMYKCLSAANVCKAEETEAAIYRVRFQVEAATKAVIKEAKTDPDAAKLISIPTHLDRIQANTGRMASAIRRKAEEGVLFSDRGIAELEYLFERYRDIVLHVKELLVDKNMIVVKHIMESYKALEKKADEAATKHEERLIEGLCLPTASSMFLDILDSMKTSAWHAREIAKDLEK